MGIWYVFNLRIYLLSCWSAEDILLHFFTQLCLQPASPGKPCTPQTIVVPLLLFFGWQFMDHSHSISFPRLTMHSGHLIHHPPRQIGTGIYYIIGFCGKSAALPFSIRVMRYSLLTSPTNTRVNDAAVYAFGKGSGYIYLLYITQTLNDVSIILSIPICFEVCCALLCTGMLGVCLKIFSIAGCKRTQHTGFFKSIELYPDGVRRFSKFRFQAS